MVFGQLVMPAQCCAGARRRAAGAPAQRCTGMTNCPNTIQCLGKDDLMSLGIMSSAFLRVFTMGSWIPDGFLDSRWVLGFMMGSWVHDVVHVKSLDFFEPCAKAAKESTTCYTIAMCGDVTCYHSFGSVEIVIKLLPASSVHHTKCLVDRVFTFRLLWMCWCC